MNLSQKPHGSGTFACASHNYTGDWREGVRYLVDFIRFLLLVGLILNAFCFIRVFGFESELQAWQGSEYFLQWRHLCGAGACDFSKVFFLFSFFKTLIMALILVMISCFSHSGWMTRDTEKENWPGSLEGQIWVFTKSCRFKRSFIHREGQL